MRWHMTVARILLILSVGNVALATPAIVREIHQVRGDVMDQPIHVRQSMPPGLSSPASDYPSSETPPESNPGSPSSKRPSSATLSDSDRGSTDIWDKSPQHSTTSDETPPPDSRPPSSATSPEPNKGTTKPAQPAHPALPAKKVKPKFMTDELKVKLNDYAVLGLVAGLFTGVAGAIQKEVQGSVSPGAQTVQKSRDLGDILNVPTTSSGVIGRGAGTPLHELLDRFQNQKNLVSRSLSNMRDEDLRLLSVLTRRVIERLD